MVNWKYAVQNISASFNATYHFLEGRGTVDLGVDYNGHQEDDFFDAFFSTTRVNLDSYVLVNVASSYQLTDNVELFARVENATNTDYEESYGFNSNGVAGFGGIRIKFSTGG